MSERSSRAASTGLRLNESVTITLDAKTPGQAETRADDWASDLHLQHCKRVLSQANFGRWTVMFYPNTEGL